MRILIVDDAHLIRLYYRKILETHDYEVDEALNGLEALEKLLENPYDMLIVDVNMPQMDGLTFLSALRRLDPPLCEIPALMITTEAQPHDVAAARAAGANGYLVKPLSGPTLVDHVAFYCGRPS
jgi:two-component system chemotaxis response regulator CheY